MLCVLRILISLKCVFIPLSCDENDPDRQSWSCTKPIHFHASLSIEYNTRHTQQHDANTIPSIVLSHPFPIPLTHTRSIERNVEETGRESMKWRQRIDVRNRQIPLSRLN